MIKYKAGVLKHDNMRQAPKPKISSISDLPIHLKPYVVSQEPELYTPMDHAQWRFIMKIASAFFAKHAHSKYLDGLKATGVSLERIPLISEMDQKLSQFGWHCVGVAGFIPPAVFLEFLSLGVLPIACDMRKFEHIAYTPAPDIVHESAGHAPIIADPGYATYLHNYGEVARRAIFSHKDLLLYEAIRHLSDVKEDPNSTESEIAAAQSGFEAAYKNLDVVSEATKLARMSWWTIEYGLVGTLDNFKIYGAGLLSSVDESYNCVLPHVKKIPFSIDCIEQSYDITKPQPQLYVAKDFDHLNEVLEEFSQTMAYKKGGLFAVQRAAEAKTVTTTELDSGLQISGVLESFELDSNTSELCFLKFSGPVQLAFKDRELRGLGAMHLKEGFISPLGKLKHLDKSLFDVTAEEFLSLGFRWNQKARIEWQNGYVVEGVLRSPISRDNKRLALELENAMILSPKGVIVERFESSPLVLVSGAQVISCFGGAADRASYASATQNTPVKLFKHKSNLTVHNEDLNKAYKSLREMRETPSLFSPEKLRDILNTAADNPGDWLLRYELLEQTKNWNFSAELKSKLYNEMQQCSKEGKHVEDMINRGTALL